METIVNDFSVFAFRASYGHVYEVIVQPDRGVKGTQIIEVFVDYDDNLYASANNLLFYHTAHWGAIDVDGSVLTTSDQVIAFSDDVDLVSSLGCSTINISVKDLTTGELVKSEFFGDGLGVYDLSSCDISCLEEDVASILNTI